MKHSMSDGVKEMTTSMQLWMDIHFTCLYDLAWVKSLYSSWMICFFVLFDFGLPPRWVDQPDGYSSLVDLKMLGAVYRLWFLVIE